MKKVLLILTLMAATFATYAHTWEIRVKQNQNGTLTWYGQSYHGVGECGFANSGININGVNYNWTAEFSGSVVGLTPTVLTVSPTYQNCNCGRSSYGTVTTPFIPGNLNVTAYSTNACYALYPDMPTGNGAFIPPPPPVCTSCPVTGWNNTVASSGNNNGTPCDLTDDKTTATISVNHLACANITGDKQFSLVFDPGGANVSYGPFNYAVGVQTNVVINIPYGTSNSTQVKVIDADFPCEITHGLSIPGGTYGGEKENIPPTVTCPSNFNVSNDLNSCSAVVNYSIPVSDNCGIANIQQLSGLPSGSSFPLGTTTNTFKVSDPSGNFVNCSFTVTVNDVQAPTAKCKNATVVIDANGNASVAVADINNGSYDNCSSVTVSIPTGEKTTFTCVDAGQSFQVTLLVKDAVGLTSTCVATVSVTDPNSICNHPPVAVCQAVTVSANGNCQGNLAATAFDGGSTDADAGDVLTYSLSPAGPYALGVTNVTLTVTDSKGASSTCNTTVTVVDDLFPVLNVPATIAVFTDANVCGATVTYTTPVGTDNCVVTTVQTAGLASGSVFPVGTTTNTFVATDASGNSTTSSFNVVVTDNQVPVLVGVPADATVECNAVPAAATVTATDNCTTSVPSYTETRTNGSCPSSYTLTRTWSTTDASNNTTTASQTITVQDTQAPVLSAAPADALVSCDAVPAAAVLTATDNCDVTTVAYTQTSTQSANAATSGYYNYTLTRTWTATDACGNSSSKTQTITVQDVTKPSANCKPVTVTLVNGIATITASSVNDNSSDNCGPVILSVSKTSFTCANIGSNTVTLTVKDVSGNTNTCTAVVTVVGEIPTCSITSIPTNNTFTGGVATNLYLGYGAQSTTLQVNAPASGAPYTYSWSGTGLNYTNTSNPVFTPTTAGNYNFTVLVTNKYGCTTTCSISICVTDIRVLDKKGLPSGKVYVCHIPPGNPGNPQTLEISVNAVPAHVGLHGGDRLGSCTMQSCTTAPVAHYADMDNHTHDSKMEVVVAPNPSTTYFELSVKTTKSEPLSIKILDANGRLVESRSKVQPNSYLTVGGNYVNGTYYAQIVQGNERVVVKLVKSN